MPILRTDTTDNWLTRLATAPVPAGPVNDIARVFNEPNARHRGFAKDAPEEQGVNSISHPIVASPLRISETAAATQSPAPLLGVHTDCVLQTILGLENEKLGELHRLGIIQQAGQQSD